jgi:hypothetical protein
MPKSHFDDQPGFVRPMIIESASQRFFLHAVPSMLGAVWSVPRVALRPAEKYQRRTVLHLRRSLGLPCVRIAPVAGRLNTQHPAMSIEYVVLAAPAAGTWPLWIADRLGPTAVWWTREALRTDGASLQPPQLLDLLDGYWDCWQPDGEVSLD